MIPSDQPRPSPDFRKPPRVFDFFSGCGGTSAGLKASGMEIAVGIDNDRDAAQTFQTNFPEADFLCADIRDLPTRSLDRSVKDRGGAVRCCSVRVPRASRFPSRDGLPHLRDDERLGLLNELLRFVKEYRPELLFVENVRGLREKCIGQEVLEPVTETLQRLGYHTKPGVVRSQDYGVPQRRARLVLLASLFVLSPSLPGLMAPALEIPSTPQSPTG